MFDKSCARLALACVLALVLMLGAPRVGVAGPLLTGEIPEKPAAAEPFPANTYEFTLLGMELESRSIALFEPKSEGANLLSDTIVFRHHVPPLIATDILFRSDPNPQSGERSLTDNVAGFENFEESAKPVVLFLKIVQPASERLVVATIFDDPTAGVSDRIVLALVPEPGTLALGMVGFLGLLGYAASKGGHRTHSSGVARKLRRPALT
jgi:hypothetical protein